MTMTSTRLQRRVSCNSSDALVAALAEVEGRVLIDDPGLSVVDEDLPHHFRVTNCRWADADGRRADSPSPPSAQPSYTVDDDI